MVAAQCTLHVVCRVTFRQTLRPGHLAELLLVASHKPHLEGTSSVVMMLARLDGYGARALLLLARPAPSRALRPGSCPPPRVCARPMLPLGAQRCVVCRKQVEALYPFGHGLSYSSFTFSDLHVQVLPHSAGRGSSAAPATAAEGAPSIAADFDAWDRLRVTVRIKNDSAVDGELPVLLFVADEARIVPPEMKLLKAFQRVAISAGNTCTAEFEVCPPYPISLTLCPPCAWSSRCVCLPSFTAAPKGGSAGSHLSGPRTLSSPGCKQVPGQMLRVGLPIVRTA